MRSYHRRILAKRRLRQCHDNGKGSCGVICPHHTCGKGEQVRPICLEDDILSKRIKLQSSTNCISTHLTTPYIQLAIFYVKKNWRQILRYETRAIAHLKIQN